MSTSRRRLLQTGVGAAGLAGVAAASVATGETGGRAPSSPLRALQGSRSWLNTAPLRTEALSGKVVLVNFWTYSCINSLRTLPYLRAWARKYADRGLVVLGVHAPEFEFEHDVSHVQRAVATLGLSYPVVLDNDYAIWSAFNNEAWPGFYFLDRQGQIRHRAFGEGRYEEAERWIQDLLSQSGAKVQDRIDPIVGVGPEAPPDWSALQSPETYVGYARALNFAGASRLRENVVATYYAPTNLAVNQWALSGGWTIGREYAVAEAGAAIQFRFHARDLHMVLGRDPKAQPVRYRVALEGAAPGANHGGDTDPPGNGVLNEDRMYQLVRQRGPIGARTFAVQFLDPGGRAYVFTFG